MCGSVGAALGADQGPWEPTKAPGSRLRPLGVKKSILMGAEQGLTSFMLYFCCKFVKVCHFFRETLIYEIFARFGLEFWITRWEPKMFALGAEAAFFGPIVVGKLLFTSDYCSIPDIRTFRNQPQDRPHNRPHD